jgi:hypothetical protein
VNLEQKTNMKEIYTDGIADIILSHGLVLIDFFHLELEAGSKPQPVPILRLTLPVDGILDLHDMSKSVFDHLVKVGVIKKKPVQPAGTKKAAAPAVEKKPEKKAAKPAPAKKAEDKPAAKPASAPAKKTEAKPAAKPAVPAKKAEAKPAAKPAPAPAKKADAKPAAKPAPAKKAAPAPEKKPAAKAKKSAK